MKSLFLSCCLLLIVGLRLQAQSILPVHNTRYYVGTIQQYAVTGQMSSGICAIQVGTRGEVEVQASINGAVVTYYGYLAPYPERTGTGYVCAVDAEFQSLPNAPRIPVVVTGGTVSGGVLNEDTTSLVFRGARSGVLPVLN